MNLKHIGFTGWKPKGSASKEMSISTKTNLYDHTPSKLRGRERYQLNSPKTHQIVKNPSLPTQMPKTTKISLTKAQRHHLARPEIRPRTYLKHKRKLLPINLHKTDPVETHSGDYPNTIQKSMNVVKEQEMLLL